MDTPRKRKKRRGSPRSSVDSAPELRSAWKASTEEHMIVSPRPG